MSWTQLLVPTLLCSAALAGSPAASDSGLMLRLTPQPQRLIVQAGYFSLRGAAVTLAVPAGAEHEACRAVLDEALRAAGARVQVRQTGEKNSGDKSAHDKSGNRFAVGSGCAVPPLPAGVHSPEAYALAVSPTGVAAAAASPAGLLHAAQTLRQLARIFAEQGRLPGVSIVDYPEFKIRGMYIEGGQERFGRIVDKDYLREQIRRLSEFKMNALVIECYNLFPFTSFPACADAGSLSREDCRALVAEAKRYHVTLVPSLQTLAQSSELVWNCDAGKPYREATAPGLMCPSTPEIYPFIKGLYRDLLQWFDTSPLIGIGCSEIDMQWQGRYCPKCQKRVAAGATVRELLLGHAEKCIQAVHELGSELKRPVRPLIWADEFTHYGPGKDWVGIERIPRDSVMGYWKYWADYKPIGGLMDRGYDVLGISAMYNHTFYLADLSPEKPRKLWPSMEQTGTRNIAEMIQEAAKARGNARRAEFLGIATASFSKHRLRAFDSIWYGFALNGHATWSRPQRPLADYQNTYTRAFVQHYYDCRTEAAADALAAAWNRLDDCKSQLELANQTLHDVVGVYDTQEPGYDGNTLCGALRKCRDLTASPTGRAGLAKIHSAAIAVQATVREVQASLESQRASLRKKRELDDLLAAGEKIAAHAEREVLLIDAQGFLTQAPRLPPPAAAAQAAVLAKRWRAHRARIEAVARIDARLYQSGDPCGHGALLRDIAAVESHLAGLAKEQPSGRPGDVLLEERFETLDPTRWIVLGKPRVAGGHLETSALGGWENRCGIATRQPLALEEARPLVVEFTLTPVKMGIDSQIFGSATETGIDSYRFSFYGPVNRFGVYTQSERALPGPWLDTSAGWRLRTASGPVELGKEYRVRAEIRRATFRVAVRAANDSPWDPPFWDSHAVPMDGLGATRLRFADVEPEGGAAASRWERILIQRHN
jgi:hypothetical protein